MRLTIYKDSKGRIILANNISAPARDNPICVEKKNRKLRILRLLEHIYAEDLEPHLCPFCGYETDDEEDVADRHDHADWN